MATTLAAIGLIGAGSATPAAAALGRGGAYLWLDNPSPALNVPYTPSATYQYNSTNLTAAVNTVVRDDRGSYIVSFPTSTGTA